MRLVWESQGLAGGEQGLHGLELRTVLERVGNEAVRGTFQNLPQASGSWQVGRWRCHLSG